MSASDDIPSREDLLLMALHDMHDLVQELRHENAELLETLTSGCPECGAPLTLGGGNIDPD